MTTSPQDDLTAERAANLYGSLTCTTYREGYQDPDNDIALLANALKTARQEALREAAKVAREYKGGFTLDVFSCKLIPDKDGPWTLGSDIADALDRLASEGAPAPIDLLPKLKDDGGYGEHF